MDTGAEAERPLSVAIMRVLGDKVYDRRKAGALEVEHIVSAAINAGDRAKIVAILNQLGSTDFASSTQVPVARVLSPTTLHPPFLLSRISCFVFSLLVLPLSLIQWRCMDTLD
jgi:hypothetical protein